MPHAVTDTTWTDEVLLSDRPVLVNFTADWCVTCKVNEGAALGSPAVAEKLDIELRG